MIIVIVMMELVVHGHQDIHQVSGSLDDLAANLFMLVMLIVEVEEGFDGRDDGGDAGMVLVGSSCRGLGEQVQLGDGEEIGDLQVQADVEMLHRHAVELVSRWSCVLTVHTADAAAVVINWVAITEIVTAVVGGVSFGAIVDTAVTVIVFYHSEILRESDASQIVVQLAAHQTVQGGLEVLVGVARQIDKSHCAAGFVGKFDVAEGSQAVSFAGTAAQRLTV